MARYNSIERTEIDIITKAVPILKEFEEWRKDFLEDTMDFMLKEFLK